jgi:hypothetical protein
VSNRYKLLVAPLLAALAGFGAAALLEAPRPARQWRWQRTHVAAAAVLVALGGFVLWAVLSGSLIAPARRLPVWWLPLALFALAAALIAAVALLPRRWAVAAAGLMVLPIVWEPQHVVHYSNKALEPQVDGAEDRRWLDGLEDVEREWRVWDEFVMGQRAGTRLRIREMRSYPAGGSLETERYRRVLSYADKHPELLPVFSVRYFFHKGHHRAGLGPNRFKRPLDLIAPRHFRRLKPYLAEALHPVPAVAWYGAAEIIGPGGKQLDLLRRQIDEQGELRVAVLEPEAAARIPAALPALLAGRAAPPPSVRGRVIALEATRMEVEIDAPAPGLVVINDAMYPGWTVEVDGDPAPALTANWWVRGVAVDAGHHRIIWTFEPRRHRVYTWMFSLALLAVILAAVLPRRHDAEHGGT